MILNKKIIIPSLSGFLYGYTTSIIASAILFVGSTFAFDSLQTGMVASILLLGAVFATSFAGRLANLIGRKNTICLGAFLFLLGSVIAAVTDGYYLLLFGRFIIGIAAGFAVTVAPIYLIEVSLPEERGRNSTFNQIGIAGGSVCAYVIGYLLSFSQDWRWMFGLAAIPALLQLIGLFFIPDSHRFASSDRGSWKELFAKEYRSRLYLGLGMNLFQSLIGAPAIFYFAPSLFEGASDRDPSTSLLITIFVGIVYLLGIFLCLFTVEKWGRRRLLLSSLGGIFGFLLVVVVASFFKIPYLYAVTFSSILFYVIFYSIGIGPIPPLVVMEITPVNIRSYAMTLGALMGLGCNYLVTLTAPLLIEKLTPAGAFCLYAFFALLGFLIFLVKLPETKKKSIDQIEKMFQTS